MTSRLIAAAVCAAALAVAPLAGAFDTTVRVEGAASTVIPQSVVDVGADGTVVVRDSLDADTATVPARSATAQLAAASARSGVPLGFSLFNFGGGPVTFVERIGAANQSPPGSSRFWRLKVDHTTTPVGADEVVLEPGDEVLWSYGAFDDRELDLTVSSPVLEVGAGFRATVVAYDNDGRATPAAGATVRYAGASATANADGVVALVAQGAGRQEMSATLPDAVRSPAVAVCVYSEDPGACGLPAPAPVCRAAPSRSSGGDAPDAVTLSARQLVINQRIAQAAVRRVNAIQAWLDEGLVEADFCGGSIGATRLGEGITAGSTDALTPPRAAAPRPVEIAAPARSEEPGVRLATAQLLINQRIAQAAIRRADALQARIEGGLTGGDLREGAVSAATLAPGLTVRSATPAVEPAPSATQIAPPGARQAATVDLSAAQLAINQRIAQAGVRRANALLDKLYSGFSGADLRAGTITAADLAPALRG